MAVAFTDQTPTCVPKLQPLWHRSAPQRVVKQSPHDDPIAGWPAWQKHLARRRRPVAPKFLCGKRPPLFWGWPREWQRAEVQDAILAPAELMELALNGMAAQSLDLPLSLQMTALAYALPSLAADVPAEMWWHVTERLYELANEAQQQHVDWPANPHDVLRQQMLAGELPLALGYLFPEVRALRALRKPARAALSEGLIELTDGEGLPHARLLPVLGPLFACWTRARWLGARLKKGAWSRKAELQYQWLVRNTLRLADEGGRFLLTPENDGSSPDWTTDMMAMSLKLAGDRGDCAAASLAVSRRVVPKRPRFDSDDLPDPSLNSDWSGLAVLASGWSPSDARLAVAYADDPVNIELSVNGERLLAGPWICETTSNGESVQVTGEWERLCWETGKRFDFLELGVALSHGLRLERQLLFARQDRVLYLADIVVAPDEAPRHLQHSIHLPLDANATWRPEVETRDGLLVARTARAAVLPLALAEWRADPLGGSLWAENGRLTLTHEIHGRALCCPLFFDLDRKRAKKERTWRQLTIAEWMEILPRDVAVGYRAQCGPDQWLYYRSLGPAGNRTVLGQNIAGEFSAGPFLDAGQYKEWVEIEAV